MLFEGRTVLVTGTSRGIGRATAERLLTEGACVLGLARTSEDPLSIHCILTTKLTSVI